MHPINTMSYYLTTRKLEKNIAGKTVRNFILKKLEKNISEKTIPAFAAKTLENFAAKLIEKNPTEKTFRKFIKTAEKRNNWAIRSKSPQIAFDDNVKHSLGVAEKISKSNLDDAKQKELKALMIPLLAQKAQLLSKLGRRDEESKTYEKLVEISPLHKDAFKWAKSGADSFELLAKGKLNLAVKAAGGLGNNYVDSSGKTIVPTVRSEEQSVKGKHEYLFNCYEEAINYYKRATSLVSKFDINMAIDFEKKVGQIISTLDKVGVQAANYGDVRAMKSAHRQALTSLLLQQASAYGPDTEKLEVADIYSEIASLYSKDSPEYGRYALSAATKYFLFAISKAATGNEIIRASSQNKEPAISKENSLSGKGNSVQFGLEYCMRAAESFQKGAELIAELNYENALNMIIRAGLIIEKGIKSGSDLQIKKFKQLYVENDRLMAIANQTKVKAMHDYDTKGETPAPAVETKQTKVYVTNHTLVVNS